MSTINFEYCYDQALQMNFKMECFGILVSKLLGILIIVFSVTLKLPQIISMLKNRKSATALTESSLFNDILSTHVIILYNLHHGYSFSSYGENISIEIQNIIIIVLFFLEVRAGLIRYLTILSILSFTVIAYLGLLPEYAWALVGGSNIIFLLMSRLSTITNNFANKNTGPLSIITFILAAGGNATRVFTAIHENGDLLMIGTFLLTLVLNITILCQIVIYGKNKTKQN